MKHLNSLFLIAFTALVLSVISSCTNQSGSDGKNDQKPDSTETAVQKPDYSDLCVEYDGVNFRMLYPKQLANMGSFDFKNVTPGQQDEFMNILENKSMADAKKYIDDNNLNIGERIEAIDSIYDGTGELRVAFSKDSKTLDEEEEAMAKKADKEGEEIIGMHSTMQSLKDNYAFVRSKKDNTIFLRFVRISEKGPSVHGELLYSADEEPDYVKLEEFIIESIQFK